MPHFEIADFKAGLDTRRLAIRGIPGSLQTLTNAHINRGGEIEKRKALTPFYNLPAGTFGLASSAGALYVFGPTANPGVPAGVTYQQLTPPSGFTMSAVLSVALFAGGMFVIVQYAGGQIRHFYNGVMVTNYSIDTNIQNATIAFTYKNQMTLLYGSKLARSKVADPTSYNTGDAGAAFYDMSTQAAGSETLTGCTEYLSNLAVFSPRTTQVWGFNANPSDAAKLQTIPRIGTRSTRSLVGIGGTDVIFLSDSGVRSLRVRDVAGNAAVEDLGTPIDDAVTAATNGMTTAQMAACFAETDPVTGRYWLTIGAVTYVYSAFPNAQVAAWSTYLLPAGASAMAVLGTQIYVRAGDTIYLYGGANNNTYDSSSVSVELPYIDGRTITDWKSWKSIDVACTGTWDIYASFNPALPNSEDFIATITGSTFFSPDTAFAAYGPLVKLRFLSSYPGPAKISGVVLRYDSARPPKAEGAG